MTTTPRSLSSPRVVNIDDLRCLARVRLPDVVFDYLDGGADAEITLKSNCSAFTEVTFRPHGAIATPECDLRTQVLGMDLALPLLLAPVGFSRLMHPGGEVAAAGAASAAGIGYILSTISGYRLEEVKAATQGPAWYQLYLIGGRSAAEAAMERARVAGFSALAVTVDTPVAGMRERDIRNGTKELMSDSLLAKIPFLPQLLTHPRWLTAFLRDGGLPNLVNVVIPGQGPMQLMDAITTLFHAVVTWEDLQWIRKSWPGPIVVKGLLTGDDARRAIDEGAHAVVVSNHGGRQLDCVSPSLRALPEVVAAVNGQVEVLMDGGIRRGGDIVKALCLGARAVLIGRSYAYGLAAAGQPGVSRAIEILRLDLERTLKLLGTSSIQDLNGSWIEVPDNWRSKFR